MLLPVSNADLMSLAIFFCCAAAYLAVSLFFLSSYDFVALDNFNLKWFANLINKLIVHAAHMAYKVKTNQKCRMI